MAVTAGYDVGGAHLKVARAEDGRVVAVASVAMPLWRGLEHLDAALAAVTELTHGADRHAVTMTAELTELFESRAAGVAAIMERLRPALGNDMMVFAGLKGFDTPDGALSDPSSVASANFLATARVVSRLKPGALLIDMGSTTTDIVACDRPQGLSDAERMQTGELVYTGLTRTPVPSVTNMALLLGQWQTLARDCFATMADVRRVLGELDDDLDLHETADGRGKSVAESLARLSRGFGRDGEMRHLTSWQAAAAYVNEMQIRSIHDGALQVLSRPGIAVASAVAAGIGANVAERVSARLGLACCRFGDLITTDEDCRAAATRHAPAVAVALLAEAQSRAAI